MVLAAYQKEKTKVRYIVASFAESADSSSQKYANHCGFKFVKGAYFHDNFIRYNRALCLKISRKKKGEGQGKSTSISIDGDSGIDQYNESGTKTLKRRQKSLPQDDLEQELKRRDNHMQQSEFQTDTKYSDEHEVPQDQWRHGRVNVPNTGIDGLASMETDGARTSRQSEMIKTASEDSIIRRSLKNAFHFDRFQRGYTQGTDDGRCIRSTKKTDPGDSSINKKVGTILQYHSNDYSSTGTMHVATNNVVVDYSNVVFSWLISHGHRPSEIQEILQPNSSLHGHSTLHYSGKHFNSFF